jgi:hypothetical protein
MLNHLSWFRDFVITALAGEVIYGYTGYGPKDGVVVHGCTGYGPKDGVQEKLHHRGSGYADKKRALTPVYMVSLIS